MRWFVALAFLGGCLGGSLDSNGRPAVIPKLSELPGDAQKRDAVLDQSGQTAGPEQRKGMTKKERKAETWAALAAAIIGDAFSSTHNVTIGSATTFEENDLGPDGPQPKRPASSTEPAVAPEQPADASQLTPWIRLK